MWQTVKQWLGGGSPEAEPAQHFALPEGVRVYAVGDIHGRARLLRKMLQAIAEDAVQHRDKKVVEVFLGDYVDRGMESREVVDLLLAPSILGHTRVCLKGNHEETLLKFLEDPSVLRGWANYGGYATLASYGIDMPTTSSPEKFTILRDSFSRSLPPEHLAFFQGLKLSHFEGDYCFVHAGLHPMLAFQQQSAEHLLWIREPFLKHRGFFSHYIVHGHSPVPAPDIRPNRANIDLSAAEKDSLCCLVMEGQERRPIVVVED